MGEDAGVPPNELLGQYLNDHLAGAVVGCDSAQQIEAAEAEPLGESMSDLVVDSKADRLTPRNAHGAIGHRHEPPQQTERLEGHRLRAAIDASGGGTATG